MPLWEVFGHSHSFRLVLLRGGKIQERKSPKVKEKRFLRWFFALKYSVR